MTNLELLFDIEATKKKLESLTWQEKQKNEWNADLKKINEIYDKLSFLNKKGIQIEKVFCSEFNQKNANNGFYPILRFPQFLATFKPIHDDENFEFEARIGKLQGKYNCETFIKKITKYIN